MNIELLYRRLGSINRDANDAESMEGPTRAPRAALQVTRAETRLTVYRSIGIQDQPELVTRREMPHLEE